MGPDTARSESRKARCGAPGREQSKAALTAAIYCPA